MAGQDEQKIPLSTIYQILTTERTFGMVFGMANDAKYLAKLQDYYARHRTLPSYASIGAMVGLRSKASVAEMTIRLKTAGFLESAPDRRLKPGKRFFERGAAESVSAGTPRSAADIHPDSMSIDSYLIGKPSRTMMLTVRGDSMIDAGIHPGDRVVVEKRNAAMPGDIVVAIVNNEFTLKRLAHDKGRLILKPENKAYPIIYPKEDSEIYGVVVGLVRKYT